MKGCAFCRAAARLSGEHIWSDWINGVVPGRSYTFRRIAPDGSVLNQWTSSGLDLRAKVVCESCNSSWMSAIENDAAKPTIAGVLLGCPVSLLPAGIVSIAVWAFKLAVIADYMQSHRPKPFFPERARTAFRETLKIPFGVQVWLSAHHNPGSRDGVFKSHYIQAKSGRSRGYEWFVVTYGIAPLLLQVSAVRWNGLPAKRPTQHLPLLTQHPFWDRCSIPLWPRLRPLTWPPPGYLGDDMIERFVYRFRELSESRKHSRSTLTSSDVVDLDPSRW